MLRTVLTALFESAFKVFTKWLEKRRVRTLEKDNIILSVTDKTMRKGIEDAKKRAELDRALAGVDNDELSELMRRTRDTVRKSLK